MFLEIIDFEAAYLDKYGNGSSKNWNCTRVSTVSPGPCRIVRILPQICQVFHAESYAEVTNLRWEPADLSRGLLVLGEEWSNGFDSRSGNIWFPGTSVGCLPGAICFIFSTSNDGGKKKVSTVPWQPTTLVFRVYDPYIEGLKHQFFMGFWVQR